MIKKKFIREKNKNKNTFYFKEHSSTKLINQLDILKIKKNAKSRICLHENINSKLQEMIIFHKKGTFIKPHFHKKAESLLMISGKMEVKIYNSLGEVIENIFISEFNKKINTIFLYKFEKNVIHSQYFYKDSIFKEVTLGPFKTNNTINL